ncbi:hypothetical protein K461DRAFT_290121 [Myriangium duriaei CBS 260.36]|uniref:Rhodopsin domain-containing protein n=1 Tax=Myriangium duriaei CBS 260.36 TaxID=1168546 RepID=A0A9P4JCZ6_9PEZI|nr:hypothetical protein K461DRAFT_290121 [Myriangium duriaei CBS 260.36]
MSPSTTTSVLTPSPVSDASYATWTDDPVLDPITATIRIPLGLVLGNYIAALVLSTICVGVRIHIRRVMIKEIAWDDWTLIAAYISYVAYIAFGLGYSLNIQIKGMEKAFWESFMLSSFWELAFVICTILVRGAIATFFLRALPRFEHSKQRITIIATFWIYAIFMIIFCFLNMWQCGNPTNTGWAHAFDTCQFTNAMTILPIFVRVLTMILDWVMTLVPNYVVLRSSMTPRAKATVVGLMVLAGIGSTTSVLSIVYNDFGDIEYPSDVPNFIRYTIYSLWENGAGIMVVSLAAMRPLFGKIKENIRRTNSAYQDQAQDVMYIDSAPTMNESEAGVKDDMKKPVALLSELNFSTRAISWVHVPVGEAPAGQVAELKPC